VHNPPITSISNPLVKRLARLRKRRERDTTGHFLIEGTREVRRAVSENICIEQLLFAPDLAKQDGAAIAKRIAESIPITTVGVAVLSYLSRRTHPDGIIAVARAVPNRLIDLDLSATPLILVAEAIEKPGNLGAMIRTAEATSIDAVIATNPETDLTNPHVIRASQGAVFSVATTICNERELIKFLDSHGIQLFALTPDGNNDLWETDFTGSSAIAVGSEHQGLSEILREAGRSIRVPMAEPVDSLNTSVTAGVALYEAVRQRRQSRTSP